MSIDSLFDRNLLTFDIDGAMIVAQEVTKDQLDILGIPGGVILQLQSSEKAYMTYHKAEFDAKHGSRWYRR